MDNRDRDVLDLAPSNRQSDDPNYNLGDGRVTLEMGTCQFCDNDGVMFDIASWASWLLRRAGPQLLGKEFSRARHGEARRVGKARVAEAEAVIGVVDVVAEFFAG
jgi:hypothetical protein